MQIDTKIIKADKAVEIYISAVATAGMELGAQAEELFSGIKDLLDTQNAIILQERIFGTNEALDTAKAVRKKIYGELDDGVDPTLLLVPEGINGQLAGVQVHAVSGHEDIQIVRMQDKACGRIVTADSCKYITLCGIHFPEAGDKNGQAKEMLEKSHELLTQIGSGFLSVPRTWMWLGNILDWYDDFNEVRNKFFIDNGLIKKDAENNMPASTGIGIGPNDGSDCTMDLTAVILPKDSIEYLDVGGNQESAYDYGSAFSRASMAITPAGKTIFVSGTAAIDHTGITEHVGDAEKQIAATIENVRAVLGEMNCGDGDVVHSLIYCKTPEIEKLFVEKWGDLPWPKITTVTDVCRDNLLFEIEATAMIKA
jgi:enamine deaminase RidA (YjgF/YER057c/UK114 family)